MQKLILILLLATLAIAAETGPTQDEIDSGLCKCSGHAFKKITDDIIADLDLKEDTEVIEAFKPFRDTTAENVNTVPAEDWKCMRHMAGEATCCTEKTVGGVRRIMEKVNKNAREEPTLLERQLAGLMVTLKACGAKDGVTPPERTRKFLAQYKAGEVTGKDLYRNFCKIRSGLLVNNNKRFRAGLVAVCKSSCSAGDFVDIKDDTTAVLVEKKSDTENSEKFDALTKDLKKAADAIQVAIKWFFDTFGSDKCKDVPTALVEDMDADHKTSSTRPEKISPKAPSARNDADAEKASPKAGKHGFKGKDRSQDTTKDGKVEAPADRIEKLKAADKKSESRRKEEGDKMKEKAKTYVKIDSADIKAQVEAAKQAGCQPPCGTCTDDGDTCTGCIYPLRAAATFGTDTKCIRLPQCKRMGGKLSEPTATNKYVTCTLPEKPPGDDSTDNFRCLLMRGCTKCNTAGCAECDDEKFWKNDKGMCVPKCVKDSPMCKTCDSAFKKCTACPTGLSIQIDRHTGNTRCVKPFECKATTDGKFCKTCTDDKSGCFECHPTYTKTPEGKCLPPIVCQVDLLGCTTCNADLSKCTACKTGTPDTAGRCPPPCNVGDNHCTACKNATECQTCETKFALDTLKKQCKPECVANQRGCTTCSTQNKLMCETCDNKHTKNMGKCFPNADATVTEPTGPGRRVLAETEVTTKQVETGGITAEVGDDDDNDVAVDGVDGEGNCENADDCKASETTYNSDGQVVNSSGDIVAESSANLIRFASIFAILAFITTIFA